MMQFSPFGSSSSSSSTYTSSSTNKNRPTDYNAADDIRDIPKVGDRGYNAIANYYDSGAYNVKAPSSVDPIVKQRVQSAMAQGARSGVQAAANLARRGSGYGAAGEMARLAGTSMGYQTGLETADNERWRQASLSENNAARQLQGAQSLFGADMGMFDAGLRGVQARLPFRQFDLSQFLSLQDEDRTSEQYEQVQDRQRNLDHVMEELARAKSAMSGVGSGPKWEAYKNLGYWSSLAQSLGIPGAGGGGVRYGGAGGGSPPIGSTPSKWAEKKAETEASLDAKKKARDAEQAASKSSGGIGGIISQFFG